MSGSGVRLAVDLVPASQWGDNLRSRLRPSAWDRLRRACYEAAGNKCEVCGGKGRKWPVEAHERWEYDTEARVQKLVGLIALCPTCHLVKHMGRAFATGQGARAVKHLRKVNGWSEQECAAYLDAVWAEWEERSRHEWTLDISFVEGLSR